MSVSVESIVSLLSSKGIDTIVDVSDINIEVMAAIGKGVRRSICYFVGDNPVHLAGIKDRD